MTRAGIDGHPNALLLSLQEKNSVNTTLEASIFAFLSVCEIAALFCVGNRFRPCQVTPCNIVKFRGS